MIYFFLQYVYLLSEAFFEDGNIGMRIGYNGIITLLTIYLSYLLIAFAVYYLLKSFGMYKMAKKRGFEKPALCFVPFYSLFMLSKLRSECEAFKKHSFYPIVATVSIGIFVLCSAVIDSVFSIGVFIRLKEMENAAAGSAYLTKEMFSGGQTIVRVLNNLMDIAKIVYIVFVAMLYSDLFRTYAPFNAKTHIVLSIIFTVITGSSFLFGAFTLALSGKTAVNFDEILEKRRIYYGSNTPYGRYNPFGNGGSGSFGNGRSGSVSSSDDIDPFSDFSSHTSQDTHGASSSKNDDPFGEFSDNKQNNNSNNSDPFGEFSSSDSKRTNSGSGSDDDSDSLF